MKTKKTRETRAGYRVKSKARVVALRSVKPRRVSGVPEGPSWQELEASRKWKDEHSEELEREHPGRYVAIWKMQVIGAGKTWGEAFDNARGRLPRAVPWVTYVSAVEEKGLVYALSI